MPRKRTDKSWGDIHRAAASSRLIEWKVGQTSYAGRSTGGVTDGDLEVTVEVASVDGAAPAEPMTMVLAYNADGQAYMHTT